MRAHAPEVRLCSRASELVVGDLRWSKLGIIAFEDTPILSTRGLTITPELFLASLALRCAEEGKRTLLLLNAGRTHELALSGEEGLKMLSSLVGERIFYFGPEGEGHLAGLPRAAVDMAWLSLNPGYLARAVEEASPVRRKVKEIAFSDVEGLSSFLVEKMGPPSFKEDLVSRIKGADKTQVAADALYGLSAIFNPTSIAIMGLKYAAKLVGLIRERRREEYKKLLDMWKKNVEDAFSVEKLSRMVSDGGLNPLKERLDEEGLAVIVQNVVGTPSELLLPLLIANAADELGEAVLVLDGASYLSRFPWAVEVISSLPSEHPGLRIACYIHTGGVPAYEKLPDLIRSFSSERLAVFDVAPSYVDVICGGRPASFRAAFLRALEDAARERLSGAIAFVLYDAVSEPLPRLVAVRPGILSRIREALRTFFRQGTQKVIKAPRRLRPEAGA